MLNFQYRCSECGKDYPIEPGIYVCPGCSAGQLKDQPIHGILDVMLEGRVEKDFDPLELLPVEAEYFPDIPVGNTPLWKPERLASHHGFPRLYLKADSLNPTGSLKDRASYLVAAFARKHQIKKIIVASTGNAGSSMAGVGAAAGLDVMLFLPETAPKA
ncbi:MAG: pyridoxal-phosphate dependent enzyme, partial [bacterium]|nr:pyridoxal-phosphate dependent enzyme [bacterium]